MTNSPESPYNLSQRSLSWELRQLPEDPNRQTFRGRYTHLDKKTIELINPEKLPVGSDLRVLDFAGGILQFGSPTAHDLFDSIQATGLKPNITVVDVNIPNPLKPNYPEISYLSSLDETSGTFDLIRILHLIEHISPEEYSKIHTELVQKLREGGLLVSTQAINRKVHDYDEWGQKRIGGTNIKIMQKRAGVLVPIALLPDSFTSFDYKHGDKNEELRRYEKYRQALANGEKSLEWKIDYDNFDHTISFINQHLTQEAETLETDDLTLSEEPTSGGDIIEILNKNSLETSNRFAAGKRLELSI